MNWRKSGGSFMARTGGSRHFCFVGAPTQSIASSLGFSEFLKLPVRCKLSKGTDIAQNAEEGCQR
jgi:hypothetical protein